MQSVNGLEEARAALVASRQSPVASGVELISPPHAACQAGVGYYVALIEQLREEFPNVAFTFTVCCGDDPAIAHDALRLGLKSIVFQGSPEMLAKLAAIAKGFGSVVLGEYP